MIEQLRPTDLQARLDAGEDLVLLDVREPEELALAALPGVTAIPMRQVPARLAELDPDRPIVCICHHGVRSMSVARFLVDRDYDRVANLVGGIDLWARELGGVPRY